MGLDYEDALRESASTATAARPLGEPVASGSRLLRSDVPVRKEGTILIELSCDIQLVIDGLKLGREQLWARGPHYYMAREASAGTCGVEQVSNWLGCVLRACDGRHSIEEIVNRLVTDIPEVDASLRDYVYRRLLEGAQAKGFISIHRMSSSAATHTTPHLPTGCADSDVSSLRQAKAEYAKLQ